MACGLYECVCVHEPCQNINFNTVAPRWIEEPQDINITRGRETQFNCRGFGIPDPKVSWLKATGWLSIGFVGSFTSALNNL